MNKNSSAGPPVLHQCPLWSADSWWDERFSFTRDLW